MWPTGLVNNRLSGTLTLLREYRPDYFCTCKHCTRTSSRLGNIKVSSKRKHILSLFRHTYIDRYVALYYTICTIDKYYHTRDSTAGIVLR